VSARPVPEWAEAQLESLVRVETIRVVLDAVAVGDWELSPDVAVELRRLLEQAARWAERAAALSDAA
jgi:hypothetical protein